MVKINIFLMALMLSTLTVKLPFDFAPNAVVAYRLSYIATTLVITVLLLWVYSLIEDTR